MSEEPIKAEIWIEGEKVLVRLFDDRVFEITKSLGPAGRPEGMRDFLKTLLSRHMHDALILSYIYPTLRSYGDLKVPK